MIITFDNINKCLSIGSQNLQQASSDYANKKQRSRRGCMTCKARKKKCDELKPICSTCARLQKKCVWIDPNRMSKEEIFYIRESVHERERNQKLRNRRSHVTRGPSPGFQSLGPWATCSLPIHTETDSGIINHTDPYASHSHECSSPMDTRHLTDQLPLEHQLPHSQQPQVLAEVNVYSGDLNRVSLKRENADSLTIATRNTNSNLQRVLSSPQLSAFFDTFDKAMIDWPAAGSPLSGIFGTGHPTRAGIEYLIEHDHSTLTPLPPPQPSLLPKLNNPTWQYLYQFYVTSLSDRVSVLPSSKNSTNWFRSIFLPLANEDLGVLYSILAWLAFSLGEKWAEQGSELVGLALGHVKVLLEGPPNLQSLDAPIPKPVLNKLASFIILSSAKICHGDVKEWLVYMKWAAKIINMHGGIRKFLLSREEMWLVTNFAYHEFMLTGASGSRGALFPKEDYAYVFRAQPNICNGQMNPLLGVSKEIYEIIGNVNHLINSIRRKPMGITVQGIIGQCQHLELEITNAQPDVEHLTHMTPSEHWQHTSLFRVFQLSARMHLKQSVLKCNSAMLELQLLTQELMECLDLLLGTAVQPLLVFPVFICAINCCTEEQRMAMRNLIDRYIALYAPWNVRNVLFVVYKIWELNCGGNRYIDWHQVLDDMGWELNFA